MNAGEAEPRGMGSDQSMVTLDGIFDGIFMAFLMFDGIFDGIQCVKRVLLGFSWAFDGSSPASSSGFCRASGNWMGLKLGVYTPFMDVYGNLMRKMMMIDWNTIRRIVIV